MNRLIVCCMLIAGLSACAFAQTAAQGIDFFKGSWDEVLAEAKAKKLPVFVDVYTDWCGPCKRMEQEVFIQQGVGTFYNRYYISYRLNAEKGEGPALAKQYGVKAYPTWLFLNADGTIRSRNTDFMEASQFIEIGKAALEKSDASVKLSVMETRFLKGERQKAFLKEYLELRTKFQLDNADVLKAYTVSLKKKDIDSAEVRFLLDNSGRTWSEAMPLIANHLSIFTSAKRDIAANEFFDQHLYFAWGDAVKNGDTKTAVKAMAVAEKIYPLLNKAKQLSYDRTALYHCRKLGLKDGLKKAGYRLAATQMVIDTNFARQQDKLMFEQVMEPFLSGKQDSTRIPGFAEEKKMAARQYSGNAASILYETALAFVDLLPPNDPALRDAAKWASRADQLASNQYTKKLLSRFK
ncbi:thioredoxin family protein [Mucilaginibacter sp. RS28]|uniref:Thioredoxin family protein n=1 Tax=Mucilaginibacter straminoryzae TaxID=2932774 RepID=A0A9X2BAW8_9SPHI|nr:thioredoxin fold domain-containing protein [Mucilaginibacter straminoryzae]MCJ8211200.1 thioredoxin family protein [Mucilaginibacter straminoryzae]